MGMYTELIFGASFKEGTPKEVIDTIKYLVDYGEKPVPCLFDMDRNPLGGGSYYFGVSSPVKKFWYDEIGRSWILSSRSNIKNYNDEIEKFLEWIKPYIDTGSGNRDMYAVVIYEDESEPTIYYLDRDYGDDETY